MSCGRPAYAACDAKRVQKGMSGLSPATADTGSALGSRYDTVAVMWTWNGWGTPTSRFQRTLRLRKADEVEAPEDIDTPMDPTDDDASCDPTLESDVDAIEE